MGATPFATVNRLLDLVRPAPAPRPQVDWASVHRMMGSVMPVDYRHLVEITGPIRVADFLAVFAPGEVNTNVDLATQLGTRLGALQVIKRDLGARHCPYPLWFEPGGLLPWGCSDNGDTLYWLTRGEPDHWTVVVGDARGPSYDEYALSASEFLVLFLNGGLESRIFPTDASGGAIVTPIARSSTG